MPYGITKQEWIDLDNDLSTFFRQVVMIDQSLIIVNRKGKVLSNYIIVQENTIKMLSVTAQFERDSVF